MIKLFTNPILLVLCVIFTVFTCHASAQVKKKPLVKKKPPAAAVTPAAPKLPFATVQEIEDGKGLIAKSDCLACHKVDDKLVGPPYSAVAGKYPQTQNSVSELSKKIINGGKGVWGAVPMAPHPAIAPADAEKMIKYILTLPPKTTTASTQ
jgi:cytochrome c